MENLLRNQRSARRYRFRNVDSVCGTAPRRTVVRAIADGSRAREVLVLFRRAVPHFRNGVALRDEPGADAGGYLADAASFQPVERHTVELVLPRFFHNSDFHVSTIVLERVLSPTTDFVAITKQGADQRQAFRWTYVSASRRLTRGPTTS